ncbi:hypothetical protein BDV97DRAFT_39206 [Delphinella strobiligena]|nr:hypothetical protein BDV97DRAFT_39206 [Delphinella strobiligena]
MSFRGFCWGIGIEMHNRIPLAHQPSILKAVFPTQLRGDHAAVVIFVCINIEPDVEFSLGDIFADDGSQGWINLCMSFSGMRSRRNSLEYSVKSTVGIWNG